MNNHRNARIFIALIFLAMFIYGAASQMLGTLISRIMLHYGLRMAQAGLLSTFINAGNFAAIFTITVFSGRIDKKILLAASLFFYSASFFLVSTAPLFGVLLAGFALIGVFGATLDTLLNSLVADHFPGNVSPGMSMLHGFFGLGGLSGPIVIERLALSFSWPQVYFIVSMVFAVYLFLYAVLLKLQWNGLKTNAEGRQQSGFGFTDVVRFFTRKKHVLLWITMFFYGGNQSTLAVWLKRYIETHLNEPVWGAWVLSAMWLGIAVSRLVISPLIKAPSPKKIMAGNLISAAALIAGLFSGSVQGIAAASLVVGLCSGFTIPLILALGCEWHREKTVFGTIMPFTALFLAYMVFPPFSGMLSDLMGIPWGVAVGAAGAVLAGVFSCILQNRMKHD